MSHSYNEQSDGNIFNAVKMNEITKQLGRVNDTGLYPFQVMLQVPIDLNSGVEITRCLLHATRALTLYKATFIYVTEATSANAGITLEIGKESDRDYYYTGSSAASKAQWYEETVTLLATDVAVGDTVTIYSPCNKVGIGEFLLSLEFQFTV